MGRKLLLLLVTACTALLLGMPPATGQTEGGATVTVLVPREARLYFDETLTRQTGTSRTFYTPALTPGKTYAYTLRAELDRDGKTITKTERVTVRSGQTTKVDMSALGRKATGRTVEEDDEPETNTGADLWPREMTDATGTKLTIYQPQLEKWEKNKLTGRAAVSVETKAAGTPTYGVVWLSARTEVDKEYRTVHLDEVTVVKVNFPSAANDAATYKKLVQKGFDAMTRRPISLDRLEANLAVTKAETQGKKQKLKNPVPKIIVTSKPAVLVLVDGKPVLRKIQGAKLLRVVNTRSLLVLDENNGKYYLRVLDRWMEARGLDGTWAKTTNPPADLKTILKSFEKNPQVDLMDNLSVDLKDQLEDGAEPVIYASTTQAELLETNGEPNWAPIEGTKLLWCKNSTCQLLLDTTTNDYYVLFSGRWFRSKKSLKGPWDYIAPNKLPADFAKIPETHPRGDVLVSVADTPQAKEAAIANQVPQTSVIKRKDATLSPSYDGKPKFEDIEGTKLKYAVNTPTPVIQVDDDSYYACENGVWFTATSPTGTWDAAISVPAAIYDIPASSPINYVTNVYVYGYTPEYVYTGYVPGYFGTYYDPFGVVVYGSGWGYRPWIGNAWYGRPWTYGWGTHFNWTSAGWGFGFATGWGRPWWGPVGWHSGWGGTAWRSGWATGYGGRFAGAHINNVNFNNFSVYNRWNNNVRVNRGVYARRTTATGVNVRYGSRTMNNVVTDRTGGVYRRTTTGWERNVNNTWRSYSRTAVPAAQRPAVQNNISNLNSTWASRRTGAVAAGTYHSAAGGYNRTTYATRGAVGGYGGYHSSYGGFRSYGGGGYRGGYGGRR